MPGVEQPETPARELISTADAASILGVSANTAKVYFDKGLVTGRRLPSGFRQFDKASVEHLRDSMSA